MTGSDERTDAAHVLVVDDDPDARSLLEDMLTRHGFVARTCPSGERAVGLVGTGAPADVVLADLQMEGMDGLALCARLAEIDPELPVIVVTGHGSLDNAVGAIRAGAYDFLTKPLRASLVGVAVRRAARHRHLASEVRRLRDGDVPTGERAAEGFIGTSRPMRAVYQLIERVSDTDASVLVTGESGTGKELVAKAIHRRSGRRDGPFVPLNCAAVPASLLESELFGHARGAFTDARGARDGLFVSADGGTLFLDEIGELPSETQPKLLRALQERRVRPVGGDREVAFDARLVAATNKDLEAEVDARRFRADLYYRIHVVRIEVPPLRDRGTDVLALAQHFVSGASRAHGKPVTGLHPATAEKLLAYDWPGNVRELENAMDRAVALTQHEEIVPEDLPRRVREHRPSRFAIHADEADELLPMREVETRYIRRVLEVVGGNKSQAARILGFDRRTLYRKLERLERDQEGDRPTGTAGG